ncbi:hypothetical protein AJ87_00980 [Rhizobium yanglingense]|nr:hypothetical protein AJ87_00980 [Rhizobium yanglingense]
MSVRLLEPEACKWAGPAASPGQLLVQFRQACCAASKPGQRGMQIRESAVKMLRFQQCGGIDASGHTPFFEPLVYFARNVTCHDRRLGRQEGVANRVENLLQSSGTKTSAKHGDLSSYWRAVVIE